MLAAILVAIPTFALAFLFAAVLSAYQGWALSVLWAWFVQPLGAPHLGVIHAMGLMLIFALLTTGIKKAESPEKNKVAHSIGVLLAPVIAVLFGFIIKRFM